MVTPKLMWMFIMNMMLAIIVGGIFVMHVIMLLAIKFLVCVILMFGLLMQLKNLLNIYLAK
nr:MAG TPA: hypothetical protein [Caudoviricetes sp.]DAQ83632.1 MAG TPA: hypothetical protein [Caudoviricetes sp.]